MKVSSSFAPIPVNISMSDEDVKSIDNVLGNLRTLCNWLDKHEINSCYEVAYLVDDNKEVRQEWRSHSCEYVKFKTINASRSYVRELEGLVG